MGLNPLKGVVWGPQGHGGDIWKILLLHRGVIVMSWPKDGVFLMAI